MLAEAGRVEYVPMGIVDFAERRARRPVLLDVEVDRDLRDAGRSDNIRHTIHYKRIFEVVEDVAGNHEHKLVEALGERIAHAVLSKFDVDAVTAQPGGVFSLSFDTSGSAGSVTFDDEDVVDVVKAKRV